MGPEPSSDLSLLVHVEALATDEAFLTVPLLVTDLYIIFRESLKNSKYFFTPNYSNIHLFVYFTCPAVAFKCVFEEYCPHSPRAAWYLKADSLQVSYNSFSKLVSLPCGLFDIIASL